MRQVLVALFLLICSINSAQAQPAAVTSSPPAGETAPPDNRPQAVEVAISGGVGYAGFFRFCGSGHGPAYSGAAELKWPVTRQGYALGLRVGGYYRDALNTQTSSCWSEDEKPVSPEPFWGLNAAFLYEKWLGARHSLYFAPGVGVTFDVITVPEAVIAAGYRFRFSRYLALQLGVEGGTWLLKYRAAVLGGLAATF